MRFAFCNETFGTDAGHPERWPDVCQIVKDAGYDGIELAPFTFEPDVRRIDDARRREIRAVAEDAGLEIVGLHWLLVSPPGLHLHTAEASVRNETRDYLRALIDFAGDVGAKVLVLGSPKGRRLENGDRAGAWARTIDTLASLTDQLAARGATLCPEALPPPEADFLMRQAEIAELVDAIGHPNLQMMLDVKSMSSEPEGPAGLSRRYGGRAAHVHANDANRRGPGFGATDFRPIADALHDVGFSGYVSVEVFDYSPDPETIARKSLRYLKEVFAR